MNLHEAREDIAPATMERHRGIVSLMEELEAMDWYDQRVDATRDSELRDVLAHNRDEETEHAAMSLEWLRRNDPVLDAHLREYLFTSGSIIAIEGGGESGGDAPGAGPAPGTAPGLGIGDLRGMVS